MEVDPYIRRYCRRDIDVPHLTKEQVRLVLGGYQLGDTR